MPAETHTAKLGPSLVLYPPSGEPLEIQRPALQTTWQGDQLLDAVLVFEVPVATWARIDRENLFHLEPDARGPTFAGGFEPAPEIEIEARLRPQSLPVVAVQAEDEFDAGALLVAAAPGDELIRTESWFAMYVKQRRGPVKTGFQTRWAP